MKPASAPIAEKENKNKGIEMSYELHPLCTLFPRMLDQEFMTLTADIKANGLRQPITLLDGMILDGGNRYRACIQAGVTPTFEQYEGGNIVSFVLSANLHRRHMTAGQQAAIVASAQDWGKAQTTGGDRKSDQSATLHFDSAEKRASESGVSLRTQKMADKVAKANPELAKKVAHGEVSLPAAVKQVENKPAKKPALAAVPKEPEYNPADDELAELSETVRTLAEERDALRHRIEAGAIVGTEEEKTAALETMCSMRKEITRLEIENRALIASRDSYQRENGELKKQCAMYRKQFEKLNKAAA